MNFITNLILKHKVRKLINSLKSAPSTATVYDMVKYYRDKANQLMGGRGYLSHFNTCCMEYFMISSPYRVIYGNGLPHDISQAKGWEKDLLVGLQNYLKKSFPDLAKDRKHDGYKLLSVEHSKDYIIQRFLQESTNKEVTSITCKKCNMESWHPEDVKRKYCGNCNKFHEVTR
jgi:hypothetical protein